jgi:protein MpaA
MKAIIYLFFLGNLITSAYAVTHFNECVSGQNKPIEHFDFSARENGLKKKILVIAGIHGDEPQSQQLAIHWLNRIRKINTPSNFWRFVPELNPDGSELKTRTNGNSVDLNRNFPTKDWDEVALAHWKNQQKSHPRRFPGKSGGSESETLCAIAHIENFKPDLVISIHTPYGLFDFDGPPNKKIVTQLLPWKRLGTFPGSMGRYLWDERNIPVLTIELRPDSLQKHLSEFVILQDRVSELITSSNN